MFVMVTVFGCWLGWNLNAVQARKRLIRWAENKGATFNELTAENRLSPFEKRGEFAPLTGRPPQASGVSWLRRSLLADQPVETIWIPGVWRNEIEARQISEAFPEAEIIIGHDR
jgi:hypothetical protein